MKRIIAFIISILMSILSALGVVLPGDVADAFTEGQWLAIMVEELGMQPTEEEIKLPYEGIPAEYLDVIKVAYAHGLVVDGEEIIADAYATRDFVALTLNRAANGVKVEYAGGLVLAKFADAYAALLEVKEALNNKEVSETPEADFTAQAGVVDLSAVEYIVSGDQLIYDAADFDLVAGDVFIAGANSFNISGAAYTVVAVTVADGLAYVDVEAVELEDAVEEIDFEGQVDTLDTAIVYDQDGNLIADGTAAPTVAEQGVIKDKVNELIDDVKEEVNDFIKNPEVSFSIKGFKIKAAYSGGQVDISVAGNVADGVRVEKYYSLNDIRFDAKFDANLSKLQINEAYLKSNYNLVETTVLQGSYAASVVPEGVEYAEDASFMDKVKENLSNLTLKKGGGIKVNVFTFNIPVGSTGLTIEMNISLTISACGRIEIIVTSNEAKGYEIINNKGRLINESTILDRRYNIYGDFQVVLGLDLSLTFLGYKIVDVEFKGGIGAYVVTQIFNIKANEKITVEIPFDIVVEATSGSDSLEDARICANVQLYGILIVSVGENSIIEKIGLSKTWTIYDRSNGVFAELHIENEGIVDNCTYAA